MGEAKDDVIASDPKNKSPSSVSSVAGTGPLSQAVNFPIPPGAVASVAGGPASTRDVLRQGILSDFAKTSADGKIKAAAFGALKEYGKLKEGDRQGPAGRLFLKDAGKSLQKWLDDNRDADAGIRADMKALSLKVRAEAHELTEKPNQSRQAELAGAREKIGKLFIKDGQSEADIAFLKELKAYEDLAISGKKNSSGANVALNKTRQEITNWLIAAEKSKPPADAKAIAAAKTLLETLTKEEEALTHIRESFDAFTGKNQALWDSEGIWNDTGPIILGKPKTDGSQGIAGTSEAQIQAMTDLMDRELSRSSVFAELLTRSTNCEHPQSKQWVLAKNSVGFFDSPGTGAIDMTHLEGLPADPVSKKDTGLGDSGKAGVCKGELMMHVIEERFNMFQTGTEVAYIHAHNQCLSADSSQNKYRQELGVGSSSIFFDPHGHSQESQDFCAYDSDGSIQITHGIDFTAVSDPTEHADYSLSQDNTEYVANERGPIVDQLIKQRVALVKRLISDEVERNGTAAMTKNPAAVIAGDPEGLFKHLLVLKNAGQIDPKAAAKADWDQYVVEWKSYANDPKAANASEVTKKTAQADAALAKPPKTGDKGCKFLADQRAGRGAVSSHLNDSAKNSIDGKNFENVNCALTSMGAICNKAASNVVKAAVKNAIDAGSLTVPSQTTEAAFLDKYKGLQSQELFYRLETGKLDLSEILPKDNVIGDAQLRGLRQMLADEAKRRNDETGQDGLQFDVVMDGLAEDANKGGKLYPVPQLFDRMKKYPNGTQFEVFMRGNGIEGHWIYAEKYNDELVIQDYQKAKGSGPSGYVDDTPHHPVKDSPDALDEGMFLALAPKVTDSLAPEPFNNSLDFPVPGSEEDKNTNALVLRLNKCANLAEIGTVLDDTKAAYADIVKAAKGSGLKLDAEVEAAKKAIADGTDAAALIKAVNTRIKGVGCMQIRNILQQRATNEIEIMQAVISGIPEGNRQGIGKIEQNTPLFTFVAKVHGDIPGASTLAGDIERIEAFIKAIDLHKSDTDFKSWMERDVADYERSWTSLGTFEAAMRKLTPHPAAKYSAADIADQIKDKFITPNDAKVRRAFDGYRAQIAQTAAPTKVSDVDAFIKKIEATGLDFGSVATDLKARISGMDAGDPAPDISTEMNAAQTEADKLVAASMANKFKLGRLRAPKGYTLKI